ncbi:winged helix-turn-helix transcriptional regulator [Sporomusa acidovorans]|uniref:HTH hxlR-type domain-containing protein n=1 Tax=Sporomusa acidovorans (strain ATCC 49682 / DSM 3132 / Mol) TaxID=1123286 RepID=A0ABZ3JBC5_SPOA4|nr:helix-turn-helix domain-containing protein [Sporomusa acidovorans]OZC21733.1 HTH-type transcriptional activator HxlR [Sporomusa acidovorans DSM 3132]SDD58818.1 transcriptional regulator, HxlR family [Sporomusa acidovorans]
MAKAQTLRGLCPVTNATLTVAQRLVTGKWKFIILWRLSEGTRRFNELQKQIPHISQGILTQQLRELERDGIVFREVYKEIPPKVEYSLTEIGQSFIPILNDIFGWINSYNRKKEKQEKPPTTVSKISPRDNAGSAEGCSCGDNCTCGENCTCGS